MSEQQQAVTVTILGKSYQINCPADQVDSLQRSAVYLDKKMKEIKANSSIVGLDRLSIMAALNITNDYLSEKQNSAEAIVGTNQDLISLNEKMDRALKRLRPS